MNEEHITAARDLVVPGTAERSGLLPVEPGLRVLALAADAFGGYGGIAQSTRDMLQALVRTGRVVSVDVLARVAPDTVGALPERIRQHPPRSGRVAYAGAGAKLAASIRPHIIYCGHLFMTPLAAALARVTGARLAVHLHGVEIWEPLTRVRRLALQQVDLALCVSGDTVRRVLSGSNLSSGQTAVVYNTVSEIFTPGDRGSARRGLGLSDETVLLTVSRLDARQRHKGHEKVIPQIARLRAGGRNVVYLIAGEGNDRARLEALAAAHGVSDHVRFLGRVPAERLPDLYRAADVYVMPSSGEGFGIAFVEAMACGTPAIGLAIGGATDALSCGEHGVAVSEGNFPDALARLVARPEVDREACSRTVRARFGRPAFEQRVAECLLRLAPATRSAEPATRSLSS